MVSTMTELQQVIGDITRALGNPENSGSAIVGISRDEAKVLLDAAQLVAPLQERCQLLGRALTAVWTLVDEVTQAEISEILDVPAGALVQMMERRQ